MVDQQNNKTASIAIIGSGYWGKNLVRNYYKIGALKLICDKNETVLGAFKKEYPEVDVCLALNDVLSRNDIDALVIATPAETHYAIAREALLSGKHVYVEKPLVLEENQARDLIALAKEKNLVLMVGHLLQYHPVFVKLKELANSGQLGRINYIYSNRLNLGKIRREENILWSFAPHDISMILSLAGEEPETVSATGGNYLHKRIADVTTTHMEFPSGLQAHIFVSWLHPFKEQKLVVVGDQKMAVFDDTLPWEDKLLLYPHQINWESNVPVPVKGDAERVDIPKDEPLKLECLHFLDCLSRGRQPVTDGAEGLRVLKVLNAAQKSLDGMVSRKGAKAQREEEIPAEGMDGSLREGWVDDREQRSDLPAIALAQARRAGVGGQRPGEDGFFAHGTAVIDEGCDIGKDTKVWHFSHVLSGSNIGEKCNIGQNVVIGPDVSMGRGCKIQNNVSVYKGVTLEDGVFCGPSMVFTNIYNPRAEIRKMDQVRATLVRHGATIGANSTVVCGVTIGRYAFIGAGALVNKNVPDHALVVGNPGRQIGWVCECGERLDMELGCPACGKAFQKNKNGGLTIRG